MIRLLLLFLLVIFLISIIRFLIKPFLIGRKTIAKGSEPEELVQDPFCQTYIPKRSALKKRIGGRDYYFCNQECLKKFFKDERS